MSALLFFRRSGTAYAAALFVALAVVAVACGGDSPTGGNRNAACENPATAPGTFVVTLRNFEFHPDTARVPRGTVVRWLNCEPAGRESHTSTADTRAWESPFLPPGAEFSHRFDANGRFDYHCVPHPTMRGVVIVE